MESSESPPQTPTPPRPPTGLSFGDGFQFGCGFFVAGLIVNVILALVLVLLALVFSVSGIGLLSALLG
ncbi:MAG TPA: hypothetical protein PKM78_06705 [Anaerolineae bacterium]|nr:hypothetical protein [Anaerolineae bacterium]HNU03536.1 hypothetical protein [Anaerolineae bacterium]